MRPLSANGSYNRFGAQIRIYEAGRLIGLQSIGSGVGWSSQNAYDAHFGLYGDGLYDIEVRFPTGTVKKVEGIIPNNINL